ncbi:hypothetical protein [Sorangium cellulosum]|nr:hypothetical protein [Sorangium cellulosum]
MTDRINNPFAPRRGGPAQGAAPAARPGPPGQPAARPGPAAEGAPTRALDLPLRAMTGYEEEVVERRQGEANTAALCNEIVARCMVPPGADASAAYERVRALHIAERDVALLAIRRLSLGDEVACDVGCPACGAACTVDFRLSALPVSLGPIPAETEATLADGTRVVLRLPTAGDQEDLLDAALATESERRTFLLSRAIVRFGEREEPFDFARARALPIAVRSALEQAIEAALPDLDLSMAVACSACGHNFTSPFDVSAFFLPR